MPHPTDKIEVIEEEIEHQKRSMREQKKLLLTLESSLIENKEKLNLLKEERRLSSLSLDFESLRDIARDREIVRYRDRENKEDGNAENRNTQKDQGHEQVQPSSREDR